MELKIVRIADLKEIPEFKNFYTPLPSKELVTSIRTHGQVTPIQISEDGEIIDGYRLVEAMKQCGKSEIKCLIKSGKAKLLDRLLANFTREKNPHDKVKEVKCVFELYPKKQGQKNSTGERYTRHELISSALDNRFQGDKMIKKLETIIQNDLDGDVLLSGILANKWKLEPCYEFVEQFKKIDEKNQYGFSERLVNGEISVTDANHLIQKRHELSKEYKHTFIIPDRVYCYNINCIDIKKLHEHRHNVDLILTSPPYFMLRRYEDELITQLGHEKTVHEYCKNVALIIKDLECTLKRTSNIMINIAETFDNGVGYRIPQLLCYYIEKLTHLTYKDTLIWSKPNPKPQNESVLRPINNIEYILWFVVDPKNSKYKLLTYPVEGKQPKFSRGAKDVDHDGVVWGKNLSISKPYGKIYNHLKEQEIAGIIQCTVGKNHEVYKIYEEGHPAIMSALLPVVPILMTTDEMDSVFDPFAGTNVVGKMSCLLNRRSLATELSPHYFNIGCKVLDASINHFNRSDLDIIQSMVYINPFEKRGTA